LCNADCCINTVDEEVTTAKNLVNIGHRTLQWQPILWHEMATSWHSLPLLFVLAFENSCKDCIIIVIIISIS